MTLEARFFTQVAAPVRDSFIRYLNSEDEERQQKYRELREYYEGIHETQLDDRQRSYLKLKPHDEFSANYMPLVVDGMAARMSVDLFDAGDQTDTFMQWWEDSRMDADQDDVHVMAIRDGDAYVLVSWDNDRGMPRFHPHMAYDGRDGMHVIYSTEMNKILFAAKRWLVEEGEDAGYVRRMNIYTSNRILRYQSDQKEDDGEWVRIGEDDWVDPATGEPLGVPVVHFKNRGRGYKYGQSEIEQAIPMQNSLNKSIIDLLAAADTSAFRILTMIGGDPTGMDITPGGWVFMPNPAVGDGAGKIGYIQGEDLRPMIEVVDSFVQRIGQVSDTPLSYFQLSGQMASEGTHRQHESRMITKVRKASLKFGNSWEDVMRIGRRLNNAFGDGMMSEDQRIKTMWKDFDAREESEKETERVERFATLVSAGVAPYEAAKRAGYSDQEAESLAKVDLFNVQQ